MVNIGDTITKVLRREPSGSYQPSIERTWLEFLNFTEAEIISGKIEVNFRFVGTGRERFIEIAKAKKQVE